MPAWVEMAAGLLVVLATLADIFATILVPGPNSGFLRVGARVRELMLPVARAVSGWTRRSGDKRSNVFAPLVFLIAFIAWMLLLLFGFGLLCDGLRTRFTPALHGFDDALYVAGSSLLTLGVSEVDAHGPARWLLLLAALSGFAAITATITFILQIQSALHQRESLVLTLGSLAGAPPSGLTLLEAVARIEVHDELPAFFREWRDWSAAVLHSHIASPVLIFFRSVDRDSDWLAALEAVLDAATLLMALTTDEAKGAATLMHRVGSRTAARLCALLGADEVAVDPLDQAAVERAAASLAQCGYVMAESDAAPATLARLRGDYAGRIAALSTMLGADAARRLP